MIFLFVNFILAVVGMSYLLLGITPSLWIAIPCLIFGVLVVFSRFLAWTSGAAQHGYTVADNQPPEYRARMKNGMIVMEVLLWGLGLINIWIFASRYFLQ